MSESKSTTMSEGRAHSLPERAKEKIEAILHHHKSSCHHKRETHGLDDSINENTSLDDVRAPNVFERAKEEFEALAQVFHHKKEEPTSDIRDGNQVAESRHKQEIPSSPSSGRYMLVTLKECYIFLLIWRLYTCEICVNAFFIVLGSWH